MERISKTKSGIDRKKPIDALEWSLSVLSNQEIAAGSLKWSVLFVRTLHLVFFLVMMVKLVTQSVTLATLGKRETDHGRCVTTSRRQMKPLEFVCDVPLNE